MRARIGFAAALLLTAPAYAQTISPQPGCVAGTTCSAGTLAVGGAVLGGNALAVTGSGQYSSSLSASGDISSVSGNMSIAQGQRFQWNGGNTVLSSPTGATVQHGAADTASPVAQTIQAQNVVSGTSNTAAPNLTIRAPAGTGTGAGGSLIVQVAPAGTTGTAQNAWATAATISSNRNLTVVGDVVAADLVTGSAGSILWSGRSEMNSSADGHWTIKNSNHANGLAVTLIGDGIASLTNIPETAGAQISVLSILTTPKTASTLPSCSVGADGTRAFITDATTTSFASTVAGGGSNHVPVYCDGSGTPSWKIG
jgi:hypothetical protein